MLLSYLTGAGSLLPSMDSPWPLSIENFAKALILTQTLSHPPLRTETATQNTKKMHFLSILSFHPETMGTETSSLARLFF